MRTLSVAVAVTMILSGCAGGKAAEAPPPTAAAAPSFDADTGAVQGSVINDENLPIAGASVDIVGVDNVTSTDATGAFTISNVPPGTHTLRAAALGYTSDARQVTVLAGEVVSAVVILSAIPIEEAHVQVDINTGHLDWGIRVVPQVGGYAGGDLAHDFEMDDRTDTVGGFLAEMTWQDTQTLAGGMRLRVEVIGEDNVADYTFCVLDSRPPGRCDGSQNVTKVLENEHEDCDPESCHIQWRGFTSTRYTGLPVDFGIMIDQDFTVYMSIFYRGPLPETYSAMPDA